MSVRSRFWTAVILAALASVSAQAADWPFPLAGGGGSIEVAVPSESISIRRYRVQTSASPYEHLKRSVGASEIHYFVDEVGRGVVSGAKRHHLNFYAVCRRELGDLTCVEMYYRADLQGEYAAMIADTARSFLDER